MTRYPDFKMVAEQLVQTARWGCRMGWAPATNTNYSVRLPDAAPPHIAPLRDQEWTKVQLRSSRSSLSTNMAGLLMQMD